MKKMEIWFTIFIIPEIEPGNFVIRGFRMLDIDRYTTEAINQAITISFSFKKSCIIKVFIES